MDKRNITLSMVLCLIFMILSCSNSYAEAMTDNTTSHNIYFDNAVIIGADGHRLVLVDNRTATNVNFQTVINFINNDTTYTIPYKKGVFVCGDYAELVHNNAEKSGINCGFTVIEFSDRSISHACNAFNTTDRGLVFIDCTKYQSIVKIIDGEQYTPKLINEDQYLITMGTVSNHKVIW